jgi:hypothetical protein
MVVGAKRLLPQSGIAIFHRGRFYAHGAIANHNGLLGYMRGGIFE